MMKKMVLLLSVVFTLISCVPQDAIELYDLSGTSWKCEYMEGVPVTIILNFTDSHTCTATSNKFFFPFSSGTYLWYNGRIEFKDFFIDDEFKFYDAVLNSTESELRVTFKSLNGSTFLEEFFRKQ